MWKGRLGSWGDCVCGLLGIVLFQLRKEGRKKERKKEQKDRQKERKNERKKERKEGRKEDINK